MERDRRQHEGLDAGDLPAVTTFRELHVPGAPLLIPNPWDVGSARILAHLGFRALATTSSGFAASLGRRDYGVTRAEALRHAAEIVAATDLPVSADLEHGFADEPAGVAALVRDAIDTGLAGCSIEDSTGRPEEPIYDRELAADRIRAAAEAADGRIVLTARAENFLWDRPDLADTIARLQAYQEAGADVLYAPGIRTAEEIRAVVTSVDRPVNVLAMPGVPPVAELAALGVARISVGGAFAFAALGELVTAADELLTKGTYGYAQLSVRGKSVINELFD